MELGFRVRNGHKIAPTSPRLFCRSYGGHKPHTHMGSVNVSCYDYSQKYVRLHSSLSQHLCYLARYFCPLTTPEKPRDPNAGLAKEPYAEQLPLSRALD